MADISRLSRLLNGVQRQVALSSNTLVVDNLKIKMGSGNDANHATFSGSLTAARTISMPDANVDLADIALNTASRHDAITLNADAPTQETLNLSGQEIQVNQATTTTDGAMSSEDKTKLDGIEAGATADQTAPEVVYAPTTGSDWVNPDPTDVGGALDDLAGRVTVSEGDISTAETNIGNLQTALGSSANEMGTFTGAILSDNTSAKVNLQELSDYSENTRSLVNNFEWQESAIDYVVDNTAAPASEVSGDRYVLSHDGGAPHIDYDGASAGDIVEFNGATWDAVTPTLGTFIAVDDDASGLYQWGGSAWSLKSFEATTASTGLEKVGFDIRLASSSAGTGIAFSAGVLSIDFAEFDSDDITEGSTNIFFTNARAIAATLTGYSAGAGTVTAADSILSAIQKLDGNIQAIDASDDLTHTQSDTADWTVADGSTVGAHLDEVGDRLATLESEGAEAESMTEALIAGETLTSGVRAVRFAKAADSVTLGRIMLADKDASAADDFYAIGVLVATGEAAAAEVQVTKAGSLTATAHGLTVGQPFYLDASGAVSSTAPSTADEAVIKLGMVKDANTLEIQIQVIGVN